MAILNKRWRKPCAKDTGNIDTERRQTKSTTQNTKNMSNLDTTKNTVGEPSALI